MPIRNEVIDILRAELGEGYEDASYAMLQREYMKRVLLPKLKAARRRALDYSTLVTARETKEQVLRDEEAARKAAEAESDAQAERDIKAL